MLIAISGGHQKSIGVGIVDDTIIACVVGKSMNLHTFEQVTVANRLGNLLDELAQKLNMRLSELVRQTEHLVLAVPGATTRHERKLASACLSLNGLTEKQFSIVDDTWAGLIAGLQKPIGICAFAGTGAAVYVGLNETNFPLTRETKIDGWGAILGDFGSGLQLAIDLLRTITRSLDRGEKSKLYEDLIKLEPGIAVFENLQMWFDDLFLKFPGEWRLRIAEASSVATSAADRPIDPDMVAIDLVKHAAECIAASIAIAYERFAPKTMDMDIVFQGGMFEFCRLYRETVIRTVEEMCNKLPGCRSIERCWCLFARNIAQTESSSQT